MYETYPEKGGISKVWSNNAILNVRQYNYFTTFRKLDFEMQCPVLINTVEDWYNYQISNLFIMFMTIYMTAHKHVIMFRTAVEPVRMYVTFVPRNILVDDWV